MSLTGVVTGAAGLTVAPRHAAGAVGATDASLRVGPTGAVCLPTCSAMEARRADGSVWRRHWDGPEGMAFEFTDVAHVSLRRDGTVTFDRDLDPEVEEHLLFDHVLPLVLARQGHLVLHGGIASRNGRGVALVGSSGAGKSTLAAHLWDTGWTLGSDDGVVVIPAHPVRAEPTYPTLRLTPAGGDLVGLDLRRASPIAGKLRVDGGTARPFRQEPVDLAVVAVIEPEMGQNATSFAPLHGMEAHAELFGSTFHADFAHDRLLPGVLASLAIVVESCTVGRLRVPRGRSGLASAEARLRSLLEEPESR